jgi:hypothetical protein
MNTYTKLKNVKSRFCDRLMSVFLLTFAMFIMTGFQSANSQEMTRVVVEPDRFPASIGALNRAIESNGANHVYVLKNGATYFLERNMGYDFPLFFEAEEYPSNNPPIIRPGTDILGRSQQVAEFITDSHSVGIFYYGMDDLGGLVQPFRVRSDGARHVLKHSYIAASSNYIIISFGGNNSFRLEDFVATHIGRFTSPGNSRFFDGRGQAIDSLIVVNATIYNNVSHFIRTINAEFNYFYMDHVTFTNASDVGIELGLVREATIKNSLFQNRNLFGVWESEQLVGDAGPGYNGDRYVSTDGFVRITAYEGRVPVDVATDADRSITIVNNNFGGLPDPEIVALWEKFSVVDPNRPALGRNPGGSNRNVYQTDPQWLWNNPDIGSDDPLWATRDTIKVVRINMPAMDSTLTAWSRQQVPWVTIENNIAENVVFRDPPTILANHVEIDWYGGELPPNWDRWTEISSNPNSRNFHPGPGSPTATSGGTASWFRDLGFNQDAPSFSHAEKNYPLGNLNYYPDLRERWGLGEVITSIEHFDQIADSFELIGIYPNPFNPSTNVVFELGAQVDVSIEIFNVLGQRVSFADLGTRVAGKHEWTFNAANLTSGVYIVRLQMGQQTLTRAITLLK